MMRAIGAQQEATAMIKLLFGKEILIVLNESKRSGFTGPTPQDNFPCRPLPMAPPGKKESLGKTQGKAVAAGSL